MSDPLRPSSSVSPQARATSSPPLSLTRMHAYSQQALSLARTPGFASKIIRVVRREMAANGLRGLVSYIRRILVASTKPYEEEVAYQEWIEKSEKLTNDDRIAIRRHLEALAYQPLISIVVPVYNTDEDALRAMVGSIQRQLYPHWELCLADDASPSPHVVQVLEELAAADPRIHWVRREKNGHICAASNTALQLATGEFVALVDHDDILPEHALYEVVAELNKHPETDLIYTGEDKLDKGGYRYGPYFKPDFSLDLLLGQNMISHFGVYRTSVLHAVGGFREGYEGSQDYDLALRTVQHSGAARIRHIPAILYHWRQERTGGSFSQSQLEKCVAVARRSIQDFLDATIPTGAARGTAVPNPLISTWSRVKWDLPQPAPLVSVMLNVAGKPEITCNAIEMILQKSGYPNLEILFFGEGAEQIRLPDDSRVRSAGHLTGQSLSAMMNAVRQQARGDVLLWLDPTVEGIGSDWLKELVSQVMRPGIGIVGAKLLFSDGGIQHAGLRLGAASNDDTSADYDIVRYLGREHQRNDVGYFGLLALVRDVSAVSGACLAVRCDVWDAIQGADEHHLKDTFIDVDLCLRAREAGYRVIWTPFAELYHRGASSSDASLAIQVHSYTTDQEYMRLRWSELLTNDPFYNPNFDVFDSDFKLAKFRRRSYPWSKWMPAAQNDSEDKI